MTKKFLGFDCPGCGLQRSIVFLLQGDFVAAFKMYPAIYPILVLIIFLTLNFFFKIKNSFNIQKFLIITMGLTMMISYIVKMIQLFN